MTDSNIPSPSHGDISTPTPSVVAAPPLEPKIDDLGRSYATGRRKNSVARVWIKPGSGKVVVNGKPMDAYFKQSVLCMILSQPLVVSEQEQRYDIVATANGGGLSGQAGAVRLGIAKALLCYDPSLRPVLKKAGFLTRDSRIVERKKYGRAKARKRFQFSKR